MAFREGDHIYVDYTSTNPMGAVEIHPGEAIVVGVRPDKWLTIQYPDNRTLYNVDPQRCRALGGQAQEIPAPVKRLPTANLPEEPTAISEELRSQIERIIDERIMLLLTYGDVQTALARINVRYDSARYISDELNAALLKAMAAAESLKAEES